MYGNKNHAIIIVYVDKYNELNIYLDFLKLQHDLCQLQ
jgi:hypothetical protein